MRPAASQSWRYSISKTLHTHPFTSLIPRLFQLSSHSVFRTANNEKLDESLGTRLHTQVPRNNWLCQLRHSIHSHRPAHSTLRHMARHGRWSDPSPTDASPVSSGLGRAFHAFPRNHTHATSQSRCKGWS